MFGGIVRNAYLGKGSRVSLVDLDNVAVKSGHDIGVSMQSDLFALALIFEKAKHISNALQTCQFLVVGFNDDPGTKRCVCAAEHLFFVVGILIPQILRCIVNRAEFPLFQRIFSS